MSSSLRFSITYCLLFLFGCNYLVYCVEDLDCTSMATRGDCSFYRDCIEERIPCGNTGYAIKLGEKYCNRFRDGINCFNKMGQFWVKSVSACLMLHLLDSNTYLKNGTCNELFEVATASHAKCYIEGGFCVDILSSIQNIGCLMEMYEHSDIFITGHLIRQILEILLLCISNVFRSLYYSTIGRLI